MQLNRLLNITILILILTACTKTNSHKPSIYNKYITENSLESISTIRTFKFRGWNSLDNKHLIISSTHKNHYLITLAHYCSDLDFSSNILIDQAMSSRLSTKFDSIIVPNKNNQNNQKCMIKDIYKLDKEQKDEVTKLRHNPNNDQKKLLDL